MKEQCPRCFGRGYCLRYPKNRIVSYNCPRCNGSGEVEAKQPKGKGTK